MSTQATESGETPPPVPAAMPLYRRLEPFEGDGSAWPVYEEQVHVFFRANDTPEAKQRDIFLASCGTRVFSLLLDLHKPATPHVKTLSELLNTLRSHFSPAPSALMERFRFNNRSRREGETFGQFVAALRGLASGCAFGDQLDSLLRDRFVCGINKSTMQTRFLELPDRPGAFAQVPHKIAVRVAVARVRDEDVRQQARVLQRPGSTSRPRTRQSSTCGTQALFRRLCHRIC
ncbi:hypothetical protein HPB49_019934 [Dermacentor silvarum]|uniref:Uncharacterized protein n=1 Tax=Dermacentor silvarum TaxID=543639 RepID=A0ACB8CMN9_DERSI|nr:hypothetical protein HPB49_019934 [Dermacentor silvarum]